MKRKSLFLKILGLEYRRLLSDKAVLTLVFGGVILYALMYNYMYRNEVVREVPVAVVDDDCTSASRRFVRLLAATPQVRPSTVYADLPAAREALRRHEVEGVVYLPRGYARRAGRGERSLYLQWGNTASLLGYAAVQEAVNGVSMALAAEGSVPAPLTVVPLPLYNPTGGYGSYLIPAVLMVILFQTLLMAVSIRLGTDREERYRVLRGVLGAAAKGKLRGVAVRLVMVRAGLFGGLYAVMAFFVVVAIPRLFDLPCEGSAGALLVVMVAYLSAAVSFALALVGVFRDREGGLVLIAFFSVGYLFLSGISYPLEDMPAVWRIVRNIFPVCPATMAYVEVQTMGAGIGEIFSHVLTLLVQAKVYISVAIFGHFRLLKSTFLYEFLKNKQGKRINFRFLF